MKVLDFDCGFSIYPPLDPSNPDTVARYKAYLATLSTKFEGRVEPFALSADKRILITPDTPRPDHTSASPLDTAAFYCFMLPGLPKIPADPSHCDKFLSFSLSFNHDAGWAKTTVEGYVREVYVTTIEHFGDRVRYWHGLFGRRSNKQWGYYSEADVEDAENSVKEKVNAQKLAIMEPGDGHIIA